MIRRSSVLLLILVALVLVPATGASAYVAPEGSASPPLTGHTIVLDPGHQLGNHNFPRRTGRLVPSGGFRKPCNTTGTSTRAGFPEATFTWRVTTRLKTRLERLGANVVLTRHSNRQDRWGPCVDTRGRLRIFGECAIMQFARRRVVALGLVEEQPHLLFPLRMRHDDRTDGSSRRSANRRARMTQFGASRNVRNGKVSCRSR